MSFECVYEYSRHQESQHQDLDCLTWQEWHVRGGWRNHFNSHTHQLPEATPASCTNFSKGHGNCGRATDWGLESESIATESAMP